MVKSIDTYNILWYHFGMNSPTFKPGDRVYWEITDSSGQTIRGVGRFADEVSMQRLRELADTMVKPAWIAMKKLEKGQEVFTLAPIEKEAASVGNN